MIKIKWSKKFAETILFSISLSVYTWCICKFYRYYHFFDLLVNNSIAVIILMGIFFECYLTYVSIKNDIYDLLHIENLGIDPDKIMEVMCASLPFIMIISIACRMLLG